MFKPLMNQEEVAKELVAILEATPMPSKEPASHDEQVRALLVMLVTSQMETRSLLDFIHSELIQANEHLEKLTGALRLS